MTLNANLIECPDCGRAVSARAGCCPQCGAPVAEDGPGLAVATVQKTSKRLKLHLLLSTLIFLTGVILIIVAIASEETSILAVGGPGFLATLVGLVWLIVTKLRIWWRHG